MTFCLYEIYKSWPIYQFRVVVVVRTTHATHIANQMLWPPSQNKVVCRDGCCRVEEGASRRGWVNRGWQSNCRLCPCINIISVEMCCPTVTIWNSIRFAVAARSASDSAHSTAVTVSACEQRLQAQNRWCRQLVCSAHFNHELKF